MKRYDLANVSWKDDVDEVEMMPDESGDWVRFEDIEREIAGAVLSRKCAEDYAEQLEKRIGELIARPEPPRDPEAVFCTQDGAVWLFRDDSGCPALRVQGGLFTAELFLGDMHPEAAGDFEAAFAKIADDED
jgi:hypothetical protein